MSKSKKLKIDWDFIGKVFESKVNKRQLESLEDFTVMTEYEFGNVPKNFSEDDLAGVYAILCQILSGKMLTGSPQELFGNIYRKEQI